MSTGSAEAPHEPWLDRVAWSMVAWRLRHHAPEPPVKLKRIVQVPSAIRIAVNPDETAIVWAGIALTSMEILTVARDALSPRALEALECELFSGLSARVIKRRFFLFAVPLVILSGTTAYYGVQVNDLKHELRNRPPAAALQAPGRQPSSGTSPATSTSTSTTTTSTTTTSTTTPATTSPAVIPPPATTSPAASKHPVGVPPGPPVSVPAASPAQAHAQGQPFPG